MKRFLVRPICFLLSVALTGCAAPEHFRLTDKLKPEDRVVLTGEVPRTSKRASLVSLRWPMAIAPDAMRVMDRTWLPRYGCVNRDEFPECYDWTKMDRVAVNSHERTAALSTYYAMELRQVLSRYLPESEIVLEPYIVTNDGASFSFKSLTPSRLPTAIVIDLVQLPSPDSLSLSNMPFVTLSSAPQLSPGTCGLLAVTYKIPVARFDGGCDAVVSDSKVPASILLLFSQSPNLQKPHPAARKTLPVKPGEITRLITVTESFGDEPNTTTIREAAKLADAATPAAIKSPALDWVAMLVTQSVNAISIPRAIQATERSYVRRFDAALADRMSNANSLLPADQEKLALIYRAAEIEKAFASEVDRQLAVGILNGPLGRGIRESRPKELDQFRAGQTVGVAMALLSVVAVGAALKGATSLASAETLASAFDRAGKRVDEISLDAYQKILADSSVAVSEGLNLAMREAGVEGAKTRADVHIALVGNYRLKFPS